MTDEFEEAIRRSLRESAAEAPPAAASIAAIRSQVAPQRSNQRPIRLSGLFWPVSAAASVLVMLLLVVVLAQLLPKDTAVGTVHSASRTLTPPSASNPTNAPASAAQSSPVAEGRSRARPSATQKRGTAAATPTPIWYDQIDLTTFAPTGCDASVTRRAVLTQPGHPPAIAIAGPCGASKFWAAVIGSEFTPTSGSSSVASPSPSPSPPAASKTSAAGSSAVFTSSAPSGRSASPSPTTTPSTTKALAMWSTSRAGVLTALTSAGSTLTIAYTADAMSTSSGLATYTQSVTLSGLVASSPTPTDTTPACHGLAVSGWSTTAGTGLPALLMTTPTAPCWLTQAVTMTALNAAGSVLGTFGSSVLPATRFYPVSTSNAFRLVLETANPNAASACPDGALGITAVRLAAEWLNTTTLNVPATPCRLQAPQVMH